MAKVQLGPEEFAKAFVPGIKAIAADKLQQCMMDIVRPYIVEMVREALKGDAKVEAKYDYETNKLRFYVEVGNEDFTP